MDTLKMNRCFALEICATASGMPSRWKTLEAQVGSNSDIAVYQELGTARIPPRSFLGGAMSDELTKIKKIIGETMFGVLIGKTPAAALVGDEVVEGGIAIGQ